LSVGTFNMDLPSVIEKMVGACSIIRIALFWHFSMRFEFLSGRCVKSSGQYSRRGLIIVRYMSKAWGNSRYFLQRRNSVKVLVTLLDKFMQ